MELWIRSQDKLQLLKIENLEVYDGGNKANNHFFIKCLGNYIGEYTTKERALEVLDEIQNIINAKTIIKFQCFVPEERIKQVKEVIDKYSIIELPDYEIKQLAGVIIYEMPKE